MTEYDPIEIEWNNLTDTITIRTSNLNQKEIKEGNEYLDKIQREKLGDAWNSEDDYYCDYCAKTQKFLKLEWEKMNIEREMNGLPRIERNMPYLLVNELKGKGLHLHERIKNKLIRHPFKNINRACFSDNRKYHGTIEEVDLDKANLPLPVKISRDAKKAMWRLVDNVHTTATHLCYVGCTYGYSEALNIMPSKLQEYLDIRIVNGKYDLIIIREFGIECNNPKCDGQHLIKKDNPPSYIPDNVEAQQKEIADDLVKEQSKSSKSE